MKDQPKVKKSKIDPEDYAETDPQVVRSFSLREDQAEWLDKNIKNASKFVRDLLDEAMGVKK